MPLDWIDFNTNFSFDAYTVQARIKGDTLKISKVYDWARKEKHTIMKSHSLLLHCLIKSVLPKVIISGSDYSNETI